MYMAHEVLGCEVDHKLSGSLQSGRDDSARVAAESFRALPDLPIETQVSGLVDRVRQGGGENAQRDCRSVHPGAMEDVLPSPPWSAAHS